MAKAPEDPALRHVPSSIHGLAVGATEGEAVEGVAVAGVG